MKHLLVSCLLLALGISCSSSELEQKSYHKPSDQSSAESTRSQMTGQAGAIDPNLDRDIDPISIPQNVSGQYLVGCKVGSDMAQINSSPAQAPLECHVKDMQGDLVAASGTWSASIREAKTGEVLTIADASAGKFVLQTSDKNQLSDAARRLSVSFRGSLENADVTVIWMNSAPLAQEIQSLQASLPVTYEFTINVVSGSLMGQSFLGTVSYDPKLLTSQATQTIPALSVRFDYLASNQQQFDGLPNLTITNGQLVSLTLVGGPGARRFGINAGFDRNQFGRTSEAFVRNGSQYFGYLNSNGFVDGAGNVSYVRK